MSLDWRRFAAWLGWATLVAGCDGSLTRPEPGTEIHAELVAPAAVGAAVIDFQRVSQISVTGGRVFTQRNGLTLRAIVVLDAAGPMTLHLTTDDSESPLHAVVVDASDAADQPFPSPSDIRVRFDR